MARPTESSAPGSAGPKWAHQALLIGLSWLLPACSTKAPLGPALHSIKLKKSLREVSGMVAVDTQFLCVQDERGTLFRLNRDGDVVAEQRFGANGDYEDLAQVGEQVFVLRSDGQLLAIQGDAVHATYSLGQRAYEYESLAHDNTRQRLLFAPKASGKHLKQLGDDRPIFAFDLRTNTPDPTPVLTISRTAVREACRAVGGARSVQLRLTALAVDPLGQQLWLLSGPDALLFACDWTGKVLGAFPLDQDLLPQPEALCFDAQRLLWIGSEGTSGKARLLAWHVPLPQ